MYTAAKRRPSFQVSIMERIAVVGRNNQRLFPGEGSSLRINLKKTYVFKPLELRPIQTHVAIAYEKDVTMAVTPSPALIQKGLVILDTARNPDKKVTVTVKNLTKRPLKAYKSDFLEMKFWRQLQPQLTLGRMTEVMAGPGQVADPVSPEPSSESSGDNNGGTMEVEANQDKPANVSNVNFSCQEKMHNCFLPPVPNCTNNKSDTNTSIIALVNCHTIQGFIFLDTVWEAVDISVQKQLPAKNYKEIYLMNKFSLTKYLQSKFVEHHSTSNTIEHFLSILLSNAAIKQAAKENKGCNFLIKNIIFQSIPERKRPSRRTTFDLIRKVFKEMVMNLTDHF